MKDWNSVIAGILVGLALPILIVGLILLIFFLSDKTPTRELISSIAILGIASNGLLARYYNKQYADYTARGLMAVTMVLVLGWVIFFVIQ